MNEVLHQDQAAAVHGVTSRRLRQLDKTDNPPPKDVHGKYPAREFGEWSRLYHKSGISVGANGKVLDLNAERARHSKEQADRLEMENAIKRGLLADARMLSSRWATVGVNVKTRMLSIPTKAAPLVLRCKTTAEAHEVLTKLIHDALTEISRTVPGADAGGGSVPGNGSAAAADGQRVGGQEQKAKPGGKRRTG